MTSDYGACSQRNESRSESRFGTWFRPFPDFTVCECKLFQIRLKRGILDRDSCRKPDSEDMWMQSSFGTWLVRAHFGNAHWSLAWVNQRGLRSRNKILPRSAQILFVIGTAFQCMWTHVHVVQITIPITKRIAIRNGFRNVIHSFVNRPYDGELHWIISGIVLEAGVGVNQFYPIGYLDQ